MNQKFKEEFHMNTITLKNTTSYTSTIDAATLVSYLIAHNITISVAESCSGGLISKQITDVPGCSAIYPGGVCSYSNEMKMKWLHVKEDTLKQHGAVSAETALEMAQGIRRATGSDYGISTTGIAGPDGGSIEKPVGLVYIAVVSETTQTVKTLPLDTIIIDTNTPLSREQIRQYTAQYALQLLWDIIK